MEGERQRSREGRGEGRRGLWINSSLIVSSTMWTLLRHGNLSSLQEAMHKSQESAVLVMHLWPLGTCSPSPHSLVPLRSTSLGLHCPIKYEDKVLTSDSVFQGIWAKTHFKALTISFCLYLSMIFYRPLPTYSNATPNKIIAIFQGTLLT